MKAPIDLAAKYGETTLSNYEVFMLGQALVNWIGLVGRLGHASPASTLDYTTNPEAMTLGTLVLRDFVAWTSGRTDLVEGCEERLREWAEAADIDGHLARSLNEVLASDLFMGGAA